MEICKEKPDNLPPLDAIGLEPNGDPSLSMSRGGSGRHRQGSGAAPPSRQASVGLGFTTSGFGKAGGQNPFNSMGNFSSASKLSSDERFNLANASRSVSVSGAPMPFGRPSQMQRTASQGGVGGTPMSSNRTRSKRGEKRGDGNKAGGGQQHGFGHGQSSMGQTMSMEPVAPLQASANRWDRKTVGNVDPESPEIVDRKVKGLLNKLTMEKFDSISDQIIAWANKSEKEKDGRTLIQVIRLVFEKATDEATWSEMYARLCRKMMERISPQVQDDGIKNAEGKPITGGQLFRKYLLNRCQEDFERGWVAKEATAAAAATKAMEDQAAKAAHDKNRVDGEEEVVLYSDEYYAAQKAKRQGLGLIKFIGELFKLQMLTERIMHECVKKLLGNVENPEEEEIESLCKLLTTVGAILDTPKARAHMDVYFSRMKELTKSQNVSARMQFMLQDVLELRERKWITRNTVAAPTTIAQIHENAAKEKAAAEKESYQRQISMSRGGSRRGGDRGDFPQVGPDGWAVAGGNGPSRPPPKAGDLSNFGKITKNTAMTFGPSSVFAGKKESKRESLSRTSSSSNMFSMLSQGADPAAEAKAPEPQRKRLVMQPRSKPSADEQDQDPSVAKSESENEGDDEALAEMTEEQATKKIAEDLKEFFAVRNLDEAEVYFTGLPAVHHFRLVDKFTTHAVEAKEADAELLAQFFTRVVSKELSSPAAFEEGLSPISEIIDDIAIDAPKAFSLFATIVKSAELDEERRTRLASKSMDSDKLFALLS
ncbi:armadillo-type protein [Lyophyllum atratum]|nr:armadillo-type protein [Lyophyllum atratum]